MTDKAEHIGLAIARDRLEQAAIRYADRGGMVGDERAVLDAALVFGRVLRLAGELKSVLQEARDAEAKAPVAVIVDTDAAEAFDRDLEGNPIDARGFPVGTRAQQPAPNDAEVIFVFVKDDAPPVFTSYVGDPCWDTPENRRRTFEYIKRMESLELQKGETKV